MRRRQPLVAATASFSEQLRGVGRMRRGAPECEDPHAAYSRLEHCAIAYRQHLIEPEIDFSEASRRRPMPSSEATRRPCPGPLQYLIGSAETVVDVVDQARYWRELMAAVGMTLKSPAAIAAAQVRLLLGFWGAFRATGERAIG